MKKLKVYIAGPYSGGDTMDNIAYAVRVADTLLDNNYIPYIPHLTGFWHFHSYKEYDIWLAYDLEWIDACDVLLRLEGDSPGADKEVEYAVQNKIPVFYNVDKLDTWRDSQCETS